MSKDIGRSTTISGVSRGVIPRHGSTAVVDLPHAVEARPGVGVVAAAGPEPELADGVGQAAVLRVVAVDARLDDVDPAETLLDGPLAPGAEHALAGVAHVGHVVDHELDLAVDADLVGVLDGWGLLVDWEVGSGMGEEVLALKKGSSQSKCSLQASMPPYVCLSRTLLSSFPSQRAVHLTSHVSESEG
jgi:hypothetical protein